MSEFSETGDMAIDSGFTSNLTADLPTVGKVTYPPQKPATITRRQALKGGLAFLATAVLGKQALNRRHEHTTPSQEPQPAVEQTQIAAQQTEAAVEILPLSDRVNALLGLEVFSVTRNTAEMQYATDAATLEEVDLGLTVCAKLEARQQLLAARARLRTEGHSGMIQLTSNQVDFCARNAIDTEIFAMCLDAYPDALRIITKLQPDIRDDDTGKTVDPEMIMINAGGMAQLVMQETGGFQEIGSRNAMSQLTDHDDIVALKMYCQKLREDTGLQFDENNIPGSEHTPGTSTGGTIGIQFRPANALEHYNLLKQAGEIGNIFDPMTSIKMAWVFLASQKWIPAQNDYQYGYMRGDPKIIDLALRTWNGDDNEIQAIIDSANNAYDSGVIANTTQQ